MLLAVAAPHEALAQTTAADLLAAAAARLPAAASSDPRALRAIGSLLDRIEDEHAASDIGVLVTRLRAQGMSDMLIADQLAARFAPAAAPLPAADPPNSPTVAPPAPAEQAEKSAPAVPPSEAARAAVADAAAASTPEARVASLRDALAIIEQAALDDPAGEAARALDADAPVWGIDPAALRRQIVTDIGDPLLPPRADPRTFPPATEQDEAALGLSRAQRSEVQGRLTAAGHSTGGTDGAFGPRTRAAIMAWQSARGYPPSGFLNEPQVAALRDETPGWRPPRSNPSNTRTQRPPAPTPGSNSAQMR